MPKPVNLLTPDAPDSERPAKQPRSPKMGSGIKVGPMPVDVLDKNIYTAEKGKPPMADEGPTKTVKKKAGGAISARADGCAQRGKTRGKMV